MGQIFKDFQLTTPISKTILDPKFWLSGDE